MPREEGRHGRRVPREEGTMKGKGSECVEMTIMYLYETVKEQKTLLKVYLKWLLVGP